MGFWIATGAFSGLVVLVLVLAILRPRKAAVPAAAYDLQVYRDQLKEVDRDVARGVLTGDEAARARTEVSRRLLEADRALQQAVAAEARTSGFDKAILGAGLGAMVAGAFALYAQIGAPGYPDLPLAGRIEMVETARENRPSQDVAETDLPFREGLPADPRREELVAQLRTVMEQRPDDPQGLALLAQNEAALGNFRAGYLAQQRLIEVLGEAATGYHYIDMAEMMILAAGGYVSPEAEAALLRGLELEPRNGTARYYAGLMYAQQGRPDLAFPIWRNLLGESTAEAPWVEPIRLQIEEVAFLAGVEVSLAELPQPAPPRGPTAEQMQAAQGMSAADQQAMIEGMVAGLAERLATEGGPPEDWARLIGAQIVLGRTEDAALIAEEARTVFADVPEALALIEEAAAPLAAAPQ
ncbi:c-type cytochrome biogenesis protein CcmI [Roseicyclus persicicus]|uniref:C-type cytochrome biogenesis protein CcmI n=1 Tax=Roseicyclus persicicus TaxID=2650661 RepID=A0A7X6JY51_9RHOB|nr:c-type cytochrome biogenesis protein CcmI [Roseibacterium persicicum]NKX46272.1 c-type cytochrome biogenesis protein CcmI [Roseibacterium persicicum]